MLEVRHLIKRYFGVAVVDDVSFEVRRGEVVGYLGPNGSGKSTTAKMLTGLLEASAGAVSWDGTSTIERGPAFRPRLGYVPEEPNLYTFQSAIEYLELVGRLRNCRRASSRERSERCSSCLACRRPRTRTSARSPKA